MAILIVEDEPDLSDLLSYILRRAGHDVIVASDGDAALRLWKERDPELVLLDVGLPRINGWDVCRHIRNESATPVMIVSGMDAEEDMVRGYQLGIDDYVTKPFSPKLLQVRVGTVLNRARSASGQSPFAGSVNICDLTLDPRSRTVTCGSQVARLTKIELKVLLELARRQGQVVAHEDLIEQVWGYRGEASSSIVKGHIRGVRLKLKEIGSTAIVKIVPSVGYVMEETA